MSDLDFHALAAAVVASRAAPGRPAVLCVRRVVTYEVDLQALEFEERIGLPPADAATLALALALEEMSVAEVQAYLGLGDVVSAAIMTRLVNDELLTAKERRAPPSPPEDMWTRFRQALGITALREQIENSGTKAHPVEPVAELNGPAFALTEIGERARLEGARVMRYRASARFILWADPLHFVRVVNEKTAKFSVDRRAPALPAHEVPLRLRTLDDDLGLSPEARQLAMGIGAELREFKGTIVGNAVGSSWEVRLAPREKGTLLVLAGFPSSDRGMIWRTFVGSSERLDDCPRLDPGELRPGAAPVSAVEELSALGFEVLPDRVAAQDGAVAVACNRDTLLSLLGRADRPDDTFVTLPDNGEGWAAAVRVHAFPNSLEAAHSAAIALLERNESGMRKDLTATLGSVWATLCTYWNDPAMEPPLMSHVIDELWTKERFRGVVCRQRVRADLINPYVLVGDDA